MRKNEKIKNFCSSRVDYFSILALVGLISFWAIIYMPENSEIMTELQDSGFDKQLLSTAAMIAALILIALLALNWVAFARLTKEKGWGIYFLVVGIFYCVASVFNGVGLILTLPVCPLFHSCLCLSKTRSP